MPNSRLTQSLWNRRRFLVAGASGVGVLIGGGRISSARSVPAAAPQRRAAGSTPVAVSLAMGWIKKDRKSVV